MSTNPNDTIFIKGDSVDLQFQLFRDKATNEYWNLSNHEIRFQLNLLDKTAVNSIEVYPAK